MTFTPNPNAAPSAFQYVPVPNEHLNAVYALLTKLAGETPATGTITETPATADGDVVFWTDERLRELAAGRWTTTQALTDVMDFLAKHPGDWFTQEELVEATGRTKGQLGVVWTKIGPHFVKHFGANVWPIETNNGRYLNPARSAVIHYSVNATMAENWIRIRNG